MSWRAVFRLRLREWLDSPMVWRSRHDEYELGELLALVAMIVQDIDYAAKSSRAAYDAWRNHYILGKSS